MTRRARTSTLYVFSLRDQAAVDDATRRGLFVRIDRKTKWGNPFRDTDPDVSLAKYEAWLLGQPRLMAALPALAGKRLFCWCAPEPCHGDVLARLANPRPRRTAIKVLVALVWKGVSLCRSFVSSTASRS